MSYNQAIMYMIPSLDALVFEGGGTAPTEFAFGKIPLLLVPAQFFEVWLVLDALKIFGSDRVSTVH